jgi:thioredoxin 1
MANLAEVSESTFDAEVLSSQSTVLVDFWAPWCPPCRRIAPLLEQFAQENVEAVRVVKVNIDDNMTLASNYRVETIPTLMLFKNGQVLERYVAFDKSRLQEAIAQAAG